MFIKGKNFFMNSFKPWKYNEVSQDRDNFHCRYSKNLWKIFVGEIVNKCLRIKSQYLCDSWNFYFQRKE